VFADRSGAVVIPDDQIDDVIAEARRIQEEDRESRKRIGGER
jgi:regulator of RNase E activity RraA